MFEKEIRRLPYGRCSMKKIGQYCFVFILGVVLTTVFFKICNAIGSKEYDDGDNPGELLTEREFDLGLGRSVLDDIPNLNSILDDLSSNRVDKAIWSLRIETWWELEDVWCINQKYDGALSNDLNPLIVKIYPKLSKAVDLASFKIFPKNTLVEMTNFMKAADSMTHSDFVQTNK